MITGECMGAGGTEAHRSRVKRGYEWRTYLYGFVRPESGEVYWLIVPTVNMELCSRWPSGSSPGGGGSGQGRAYLAGGGQSRLAHGGRRGRGPRRDTPFEFLPSGSPELQPAERLWPLTNEAIANRLFEEISSKMEQALVERCVELLDQAETIRGLTNYHWWPQAA